MELRTPTVLLIFDKIMFLKYHFCSYSKSYGYFFGKQTDSRGMV